VRPNRSAAQAFEPGISAKNRPQMSHDSVDFSAFQSTNFSVMAGHSRPKDGVATARLCPAIHVFGGRRKQDVDARDI
jgi:hypothetical protein